jgi:hypothetical protein
MKKKNLEVGVYREEIKTDRQRDTLASMGENS